MGVRGWGTFYLRLSLLFARMFLGFLGFFGVVEVIPEEARF